MEKQLTESLASADANFDVMIERLGQFIAIPSISHEGYEKQPIADAVEWLRENLQSFEVDAVKIFPTASNPIVYAEKHSIRSDAPTVLIYAHYDVQPAEPVEAWDGNPFEAIVRGEHLYGRGSSDMKGQFIACLAALEAIKDSGDLPVHVKFIIEGDEETDPEPVESFITEHGHLLDCDHCLNVDAGMLGVELPTIVYGLRGSMSVTLNISGPERDLHDGMYGGVIENPIHVLVRLIAGLQDEDRRIKLPGFYDRVRQIEDHERSAAKQHPMDRDYYLDASGSPSLIPDERFLPIERIGARPSFNVRWIETGAKKSAIPVRASARLAFRLVPDQDPEAVYASLVDFIRENSPQTVSWSMEKLVSSPGTLVSTDVPAVRKMHQALAEIWGVDPVLHRTGGAIPIVGELQDQLGIASVLTGFSLPDDNIHGSNERLHLPTLRRGIKALIHYFLSLDR